MTDTLLYIAGILFVVLGIAASIAIHELGHLIPAKLFGVRVKQYMVGFGPTVFSRKRGETEYGVKAIPLGGYISMIGMFPPEKAGSKTRLFRKTIQEAREVHLEEIGPEDKGREFYNLSVPKKLTVMLGGPFMNFFLGMFLVVSSLTLIGSPQLSLTIDSVLPCVQGSNLDGSCSSEDPPSPALEAGFEAGDKVVAVAGTRVTEWEQVTELMSTSPGSPVQFVVLRDGSEQALTVTPVWFERVQYDSITREPLIDDNGFPVTALTPFLGVSLSSELRPTSVGEAVTLGLDATWSVVDLIIQLPQAVYSVTLSTFGISERDPNGPISILGVGQIAGEIASSDTVSVEQRLASGLLIMGSLNFALFVFNLIPLLPLDGGHVAGAVYEGVKRRTYKLFGKPDPGAVDTARLIPLAYLMWAVLMSVGLLLILADLVNPISLFGLGS